MGKDTFTANADVMEVLFKFNQRANKVCWLEYDLIVNVVTTRHSFHNSIQITFEEYLVFPDCGGRKGKAESTLVVMVMMIMIVMVIMIMIVMMIMMMIMMMMIKLRAHPLPPRQLT